MVNLSYSNSSWKAQFGNISYHHEAPICKLAGGRNSKVHYTNKP